MSAGDFIDARSLHVRYRDVIALNGLTLSVRRGERVALLGANGSGKSTLLRVLSGLSFPESGEFLFGGELVTEEMLEQRERAFRFRRRVGLVFQNSDVQLFNPTVFDEVAFGPLQLRISKEELRERVENAMRGMGVEHLRGRAPHQLSGGEKKRVALASVLVLEPEVLLLDEPTAGLDPRSQGQIVDLLASWRDSGKTVIVATHDLDALEEIADRAVVLEQGRVAADAAPFEVLHDVALLERSRLIARHRHTHPGGAKQPHTHVHVDQPKL